MTRGAAERLDQAHEAMRTALADALPDTPQRAGRRVEIITGLYDDEPDEPQTLIQDVITDLMHTAAARGVDFEQVVANAAFMWAQEREEWGLDD